MKKFWEFACFCVVGGIAFLIDMGFFNLYYRLNMGFILSKVSSAIISMVFNFNVNRNITFSAKEGRVKQQVSRWLIVYAIAIIVNVTAGKIFLNLIGESVLNANLAVFFALVFSIPISFLGSRLWAFKKNFN